MRGKPATLFDKTRATAYQGVDTWEGLIKSLADLRLEKNELVQAVAIGSHENLPELFASNSAPFGLKGLDQRGSLSVYE